MTTDIEAAVRAFILENLVFDDRNAGLPATRSLIEEGLIDSTGVLELVSFIEERFGVNVSDSEITPENLDSISNIARYVGGKLAATVAA